MSNLTNYFLLFNSIPVINFLKDYSFEILLGDGKSMIPTIKPNCIVFVNKFIKSNIKKGDIVISKSLYDKEMIICKRIIYDEEEEFIYKDKIKKVPKGFVWLEGDNKDNSFDSRYFGFIPKTLILGKVIFEIYPSIKLLK